MQNSRNIGKLSKKCKVVQNDQNSSWHCEIEVNMVKKANGMFRRPLDLKRKTWLVKNNKSAQSRIELDKKKPKVLKGWIKKCSNLNSAGSRKVPNITSAQRESAGSRKVLNRN